MNNLFIDSDVILDLLVQRNDYESSAKLFSLIERKTVCGFTTAVVFENVYYIVTRLENHRKAMQSLKLLRRFLSILPIDEDIIDSALNSEAPDFEDSIQLLTAKRNNMDFIITRNTKDYKFSKIPVLTAAEYLSI
jgi:predicted nucleic acid-binding protein